jgi:predicted DNA-binding protein
MPEHETAQFSVRVPAEHLQALERVATEEDRTVSAEIRRLIRRRVEDFDREAA